MDMIHLSDSEIQTLAVTKPNHPHLDSCKVCSDKLALYLTISDSVKSMPEIKLSAAFEIRVMSKLYEQPTGIWSDWEQLFTIIFTVLGSVIVLFFLAGLPAFDGIRQEFFRWSNNLTGTISISGFLPYALIPSLIGIFIIDRYLKKHFRFSE